MHDVDGNQTQSSLWLPQIQKWLLELVAVCIIVDLMIL